MELLLWPYIKTAAPQGPTALGKAPERSRGALSLPSANPHEVQWMGAAGGTRFPVLAPTQFPAVQSFPSMGYEHTWTRRCLHGCSWTCTWCCRSFFPVFPGQKWVLEKGCCRIPELSKAICSGFGIWMQQGHSCSATALSRFAEHGVSGMCWVPACRTGRTSSLLTGGLVLLQVNRVEKLSCSRQWEDPAESLPHNKPFPAWQ